MGSVVAVVVVGGGLVSGAVVAVGAGTDAGAGGSGRVAEGSVGAPAGPVLYRPPVPVPIVDGWRPPSTPFGPGNRGVDYGTSPGQAVGAAGDGVVSFAGQVGGSRHVTITHTDGVRTSYSFLGAIEVRRGQAVRRGQRIGSAGEQPLHFGARRGTAYIDPTSLFGDETVTVRLVPAHRGP